MKATCQFCGKEVWDKSAGKIPFLVCEDPQLCS